MIENAKITLSDKELELVCNTDWILRKHAIIEKVYLLFGNVSADMQQMVNNALILPKDRQSNPKISKGENYRQLPYIMLDYPRLFDQENTFAIRTFFWWGNSFSIHLLVSGNNKTKAAEKIRANFTALQNNEYAVCVADTPWEHHFEHNNYILLKDISTDIFSDILHRNSFLKLGKKISLTRWDEADAFIENTFEEMIDLLKD